MSKASRRDYKHELAVEHKNHPERVHQRAERNKARHMMEEKGKVHKGDGKQVDHIKPLSKGGKTTEGNLRVEAAHANESYPRNSDHSIKLII